MNHPKSLQAGTRIDDYEIEAALWTTNSGFIYRARELDKERLVLIQEYLPPVFAARHWSGIHAMALEGLEDEFEQGLTRFLREARQLAQINDPYVCRVYEYTEANATAYMVLDYEPGRTLSEYLTERKKPLDEAEIRELLVPLLKGLRVAHGSDLLHRDIHPANIYLRDVGPPVLIGFGSPVVTPRDDSDLHIDNRVAPGYSPVEQYQSDGETGPWTDLYALGATMYRCLSGATPVDATRRVTAIAQDKEDPLVPALELGGGDYSAALLSAVDWMMEPMASDRPASAGAVLSPLNDEQESAPVSHKRKSSSGKKTRKKKRSPRAKAAEHDEPSYRDHSKRRAPPPEPPAALPARPGGASPATTAGKLYPAPRAAKTPWRHLRGLPLLLVVAGLALIAVFLLYRPELPGHVNVNQAMPDASVPAPAPEEGYPPPDLPEQVNFGRAKDDERADEYRNLQRELERIQASLAAAEKHMEHGRLLAPAGNNALERYRDVLALNPDNSDAKLGLKAIQDELVDDAEAAFEEGDVDRAGKLLDRAADIRAESGAMTTLRQRIDANIAEQERQAAEARAEEQERLERIDALLAQAENALQDGRRTAPPGDNALAYYQRVLRLDPDNEAARQGTERVGRWHLERAADALANDQLDEAAELLDTAGDLLPDNESVPLLRKQLDTRRTLALSRTEESEPQPGEPETSAAASEEQASTAQEKDQEKDQGKDQAQEQNLAARSEEQDNLQADAIAAQQRLERGVAAYYDGDYDTAFRLLNPLAEDGQPRAKFRVAMMYFHGRGLAPDPELARTVIREALPRIQEEAEQGAAWAQADLGSLYADGIVLAENNEEAVRLYTQAAEQGYAGAQTNLGVMYANGEGVAQSRENAILWLRRAAAQGDHIAQNNLRALGVQ